MRVRREIFEDELGGTKRPFSIEDPFDATEILYPPPKSLRGRQLLGGAGEAQMAGVVGSAKSGNKLSSERPRRARAPGARSLCARRSTRNRRARAHRREPRSGRE